MSVTKDSSTHNMQVEIREGLLDPKRKTGFYLSEDGEWIPDGWIKTTIDDIKGEQKGAIAIGPFGSRMKSDCYVASGFPILRGNNITDGRNFTTHFVYISDEKAEELKGCKVKEGDLVFPHRGAIGEVGLIGEKEEFVISSSLMKITCDPALAESSFIFYFFRSRIGRGKLMENASQVGTPGIGQPLSSLKSIWLNLPPLLEQKSIASILSSLDDKIELLREQNETLEALAQTLFKRWFIDFNFPACMASPCAGKPVCKDYAEEVGSQADHPRVRMECRHPELSVYGYKDFGGMPQPQEGSSAPDGQAGSSAPDGQAGSSAPDGQAGSSAPDGQAGSSAPDGQAGKSFIYVLRLENGNRYVGMTDFLLRRYHEHKIGKGAKATKASPPVAMIHFEQFDSREEAAEREKWLKTGFGRKWLDREEENGNLGAHVVQAPMIPSELGEIPEGWETKTLSDFGKIVCGKTPSKSNSEYYGEDIPFIKIPDMHGNTFINSCSEYLSNEGAQSQNKKMIPVGSIMVSCIATVGLVSMTVRPSQTNQQINAVVPNALEYSEYVYLRMKTLYHFLQNLGAGGSATLNINTSSFSGIVIVKPSYSIIKAFHDLVNTKFIKIKSNTQQIQTLTNLRDTLLPKLMKGEIRVSL